jgi:regulatory protein
LTLSLEARALGWLARREFSRAELRRRLQQYEPSEEEIDRLLDRLESRRLLSDERFTESLIHRRGDRFGVARIRQELALHGVSAEDAAESLDALRVSEFDRARAVWLKRFGEQPADSADRLRQMRFLASRGFSHEVIRRLLRGDPGAEG